MPNHPYENLFPYLRLTSRLS